MPEYHPSDRIRDQKHSGEKQCERVVVGSAAAGARTTEDVRLLGVYMSFIVKMKGFHPANCGV